MCGGTALAAQVNPTFVPQNNPTCAELGYGTASVSGVTHSGQFSDGTLTVTVTIQNNTVDWSASQGVDAVIVNRVGPGANVYAYSSEATSDTGLQVPNDPSTGDPSSFSHVDFCYDANPGPQATPTPSPSPQATPSPSPQATSSPSPAAAPAPPAQEILPVAVVSGQARVSRAGGCTRGFRAVVSGRRIASVRWILDGRTVKRTKSSTRSVLNLPLSKVSPGSHRLLARVAFVAASQTRARTYRMRVRRCARASVAPRFTG